MEVCASMPPSSSVQAPFPSRCVFTMNPAVMPLPLYGNTGPTVPEIHAESSVPYAMHVRLIGYNAYKTIGLIKRMRSRLNGEDFF